MDAMGRVAFCAGWTLTETAWVMAGVAPSATTGTKYTKPARNRVTHARTVILFAFLRMTLSRAGFEQVEQSPHRHPGPQTVHEHLAGSCCRTFKRTASPCQ